MMSMNNEFSHNLSKQRSFEFELLKRQKSREAPSFSQAPSPSRGLVAPLPSPALVRNFCGDLPLLSFFETGMP
jgi:hypothetical protein